MSNSISYARIKQVADEAQACFESGGVVHSLEMGVGEKLYDYVFCGSVKAWVLDILRYNAQLELSIRKGLPRHVCPVLDWEVTDRFGLSSVTRYEWNLSALMSGATLKFDRFALGSDTNWNNYLIYRDKRRMFAMGIPLQSDNRPVVQPNHGQAATVPVFDAVNNIQIQDLDDIRKCGKLQCGNQTYTVLFTRKKEPIVMQEPGNLQTDLVRKKLLNLWAYTSVQKRLANFIARPLEPADLDQSLRKFHTFSLDKTDNADWNNFIDVSQNCLATAVALSKNRFVVESQIIEKALEPFATLTNPSRADKKAFIQLQEKIVLLERARAKVNANIGFIKFHQMQIYRGMWDFLYFLDNVPDYIYQSTTRCIDDSRTRELFKARFLKFNEAMMRFVTSDMDDAATEQFKEFCEVQNVMWGRFSPDKLTALIEPPLITSWKYPHFHPPIFDAQHEALFSMIKDPDVTWEQVDKVMTRMQIEQDAQIELRIRQIEMAYELDRRLGITVQNNQGQSVLLKLGQFSPEFQGRMNFLEELRAELFSPGNNFTQTELDDYSTAIDKYLFLLDVDCRRSGFVPRVIPDNAEVRFEFANPFRFEME